MEIQGQFDEMEQKYSFEKQKWEDNQSQMKNTMTMSQSQYNDM